MTVLSWILQAILILAIIVLPLAFVSGMTRYLRRRYYRRKQAREEREYLRRTARDAQHRGSL